MVFVDENGRAVENPVEIGRRTADWVEVIDGIAHGDRIIVDGAGFLADGILVESQARTTPGGEQEPAQEAPAEEQPEGDKNEG